jgi:acetyl-CoA acetyltransferase
LLGLQLRWYAGGGEMAGQLGSIVNAVLAVAAGLATHVLCFRTLWESSAQEALGGRSATLLGGGGTGDRPIPFANERQQWSIPFGIGYPCHAAMMMRRYIDVAGVTREQLAQVSLVARENAQRNPLAVYREPMSLDDYLGSRMISDPLCIYDCDVPVDGSVAVIVSRAGSAPVGHAVSVQAMGSASGVDEAAAMMWSRTDLTPADVDLAQLYDGFSVYAVHWLEALGLCAPNEVGAFLEGGRRIALDGELPLNTCGGQLSAGRLHGYGLLHEACLQLRGGAGERQVPRSPEIAVVSSGIETFTSSILLGAPR